jgi:hypothetical protein
VWFSINCGTSRKIQAAREMEPRMPLRASVVVRGTDGWTIVVRRVEGIIVDGGRAAVRRGVVVVVCREERGCVCRSVND